MDKFQQRIMAKLKTQGRIRLEGGWGIQGLEYTIEVKKCGTKYAVMIIVDIGGELSYKLRIMSFKQTLNTIMRWRKEVDDVYLIR